MKFITYVIIDPRDNVPVYVGQSGNFQLRRESHLNRAMGKRHLNRAMGKRPNIVGVNIATYLVDLYSIGYLPKFEIVEECSTEEESLKSELECIRNFVKKGIPVLNNWKEHKLLNEERFGKQYKQYFIKRILAKDLEQLQKLGLEINNSNQEVR
jgi:hypothetical protein